MANPHRHSPHAKLEPVGRNDVRWTIGFWADRLETCRTSMVPVMGRLMQDRPSGRFLTNFEVAAGLIEGKHHGAKWDDGDFYKWLESAAATFAVTREPAMDAEMDRMIALIGRTQDKDGYIHTDVQIRQH